MRNISEIMSLVAKNSVSGTLPDFAVGDSIKMRIKVTEGDKVRVHPWEGLVISKSGRGVSATFTVRKVSFGEGIERTFPINSPLIESLTVVSKGKVNRSKLYYLRHETGKKAKVETTRVETSSAA